jgi:type II secretory pathway pseudopilin PulG
MSRNNARRRAYTIVEVLSVTVVLGLVMTIIAAIIGPLLRSQNQTQAKVDTVQAAAMALYRVQRDLRNTSWSSVWACTTTGTPTCTQPTASTATQALVVLTAYQGGTGQFQLAGGKPQWQGATVYWIDASGNLNVAFDAPPGWSPNTSLSSLNAAQAVTDVLARGGMPIARFIQGMSVGFPVTNYIVSFQLQARSTVNNAVNETTYQTDVETRNN